MVRAKPKTRLIYCVFCILLRIWLLAHVRSSSGHFKCGRCLQFLIGMQRVCYGGMCKKNKKRNHAIFRVLNGELTFSLAARKKTSAESM